MKNGTSSTIATLQPGQSLSFTTGKVTVTNQASQIDTFEVTNGDLAATETIAPGQTVSFGVMPGGLTIINKGPVPLTVSNQP